MLKYDNAAYFITGFLFTILNWKIRQAKPLTKKYLWYIGVTILVIPTLNFEAKHCGANLSNIAAFLQLHTLFNNC